LQNFMEKGIDCVAITDHNSGAWVDKLKEALQTISENKAEWYRPLYLFPGVEISVQGGVHLLAIFDPEKETADIVSLLGAVKFQGTRGRSDGVTEESFTKVVDIVHERGGIAVPAHVDGEKGLFEAMNGESLLQALKNPNIYAMELWDSGYEKPQLYKNEKLRWTEVKGSDTHDFDDDDFGEFTWVKMDEPSIEGLKLALIDGEVSVHRDMNEDPNQHAGYMIEEIAVEEAKYMGRPEVLTCRFSPFLNTIIGGRGSGKSTLLEFMRFVLSREHEIPESLTKESEKYFQVGEDDLLLDKSQISMIYRKGDTRYRLSRVIEADGTSLLSLKKERNGTWDDIPGEIKSLFSSRIYSQKQIFELSKNPRALIDIIDEAPDINYPILDRQRRELVSQYKQNEQKLHELHEKITEENRLRGESDDLARQIQEIEKSEHNEVLGKYRTRQQQLNEIENLESNWQDMSQQLSTIKDDINPANYSENYFSEYPDIHSALKVANEKWQAISNKLDALVKEAQSVIENWRNEKDQSDWMQEIKTDMKQYDQLRIQLERQNIDPEKYPMLLQQAENIQRELQRIDEYQIELDKCIAQKQELFEKIVENREELTGNRKNFLLSTLTGNSSIKIVVKPLDEPWESVEKDIRRILQCPDRFHRDIESLQDIYNSNGDQKVVKLKNTVHKIRRREKTARDARFASHLESLSLEAICDFSLWFPGDDLKITFGPRNQAIEQGSPGEKTAALLAFILSYGSEPLLLDQPEDDLDNELIYGLIVEQLRKTKSKRQIIVVTHNANIVVNGDAEMVFPLQVANGQTHVTSPASIQNLGIREKICDVLEGGQQAFEQRYKRIHLENESV